MFIAIIGTRFSGKTSIENYLVGTKGFKSVRLIQSNSDHNVGFNEEKFEITNSRIYTPSDMAFCLDFSSRTDPDLAKQLSFLSMTPPSPIPTTFKITVPQQTLCFSTPGELLKYVTNNWQNNYVTVDLHTRELIEHFIRRPFFILLRCDAPLMERFKRSKNFVNVSLENFVQEDDRTVFGSVNLSNGNCLQNLADLVTVQVDNSFPDLEGLHRHLDTLGLLHPEYLRPGWETYFMADFGISCISSIQLHETQGRRCAGSRQSCTCYRLQRDPARTKKLQRRRLPTLQWVHHPFKPSKWMSLLTCRGKCSSRGWKGKGGPRLRSILQHMSLSSMCDQDNTNRG